MADGGPVGRYPCDCKPAAGEAVLFQLEQKTDGVVDREKRDVSVENRE